MYNYTQRELDYDRIADIAECFGIMNFECYFKGSACFVTGVDIDGDTQIFKVSPTTFALFKKDKKDKYVLEISPHSVGIDRDVSFI